ncbi:MAG: YigZ family protein [Clostridiales bacterium]|nr:YigZ family protein [Clostridiales bacterium]
MINEYYSILENCEHELTEKKSRFIANLIHVETESEAKEKIIEISKKHFNSKHNVFAYRILVDGNIIDKYSDNGEPSGTAGKPILDMMKQKELCNVLIVVTRYFGGILLGTGGLVRAYTGSAKLCIDNSKVELLEKKTVLQINISYDELGLVKQFCKKNNFIVENIEYLENVVVSILVNKGENEIFKDEIEKILNRNVDISILQDKFVIK